MKALNWTINLLIQAVLTLSLAWVFAQGAHAMKGKLWIDKKSAYETIVYKRLAKCSVRARFCQYIGGVK